MAEARLNKSKGEMEIVLSKTETSSMLACVVLSLAQLSKLAADEGREDLVRIFVAVANELSPAGALDIAKRMPLPEEYRQIVVDAIIELA